MFIVGNVLISEEIINKCFCCDLDSCKGLCCVEGDAGAPVAPEEVAELEECFSCFKKYMTSEGVNLVENNGTFVFDGDDAFETPLMKSNDACAFAFFEKGIAKCAIEKAFHNDEISFRKPLSCFLYPIRISKVGEYDALNYEHWSVCKTAVENGNKLKLPVYKFLKEPLTEKYGEDWYKELEETVVLFYKSKQ